MVFTICNIRRAIQSLGNMLVLEMRMYMKLRSTAIVNNDITLVEDEISVRQLTVKIIMSQLKQKSKDLERRNFGLIL